MPNESNELDALMKIRRALQVTSYHSGKDELFAIVEEAILAATAPNAGAPLADPLKVACITLDGSTLTIDVELIGRVLAEFEAGETYALSFKTMTRDEYEALGEFNGF